MKQNIYKFTVPSFLILLLVTTISKPKEQNFNFQSPIVRAQVGLEANNIRAWIWNTGVFNQDLRTNNTPGLEWPKGTNKFAIFTTGLTIAGYVGSQLRMSTASYSGEYVPGYCVNGVLQTNANFKLYRVTRGDNQNTNPDWANWGLMIPYGAPWRDVNNNGTYEPAVDIPGVKDAAQTVFICLTDADPTSHSGSSGFSGGTAPMFNQVQLTAWCYDNPGYGDMNFIRWAVINKGTSAWDSTLFSIVSDPDLGDATDDYIGCDTVRNLAFCYNADNQDGDGSGITYGINPPASGISFLNCNSSFSRLSSLVYFTNGGSEVCATDPSTPLQAYNFMKGFKKDGTPWVNVVNSQVTKFCYSGDPETNTGWTEYTGRIENCGGILGGPLVSPTPPGDRRTVMNFKPANQRINVGDTQVIQITQLVARGSNNKNSVTLLKQLSDVAQQLCNNGFVIGIQQISNEIPKQFSLEQNYPNPFNPTTNFKFSIPKSANVKLTIYDALGREVATLVNEKLNAGTYNADWDGVNFSSGIYFYKIETGDFIDTRKMVLIK